MNKELFLRMMAQKMVEIKRLMKEYNPDDEYLTLCIYGDAISFNNDPKSDRHYSLFFNENTDIYNATLGGDDYLTWFEGGEEDV